jgi:hypothetical protein
MILGLPPFALFMPTEDSKNEWLIAPLDALLTLEEAAALWRIQPEALSAKSKGRRAQIPGIWLNQRLVRFHPRMMLAKAAHDAGVPIEVIAAAFNIKLQHVDGTVCLIASKDSASLQTFPAECNQV